MNRRKFPIGGLDSLIATSKDMFHSRLSSVAKSSIFSTARFRGRLGSAIAVITSLIVGFLTIPNNILYFIDSGHSIRGPGAFGTATQASSVDGELLDVEYAYIHAGIAVVVLGCLAMVVSIVLSYFAAKSKLKMDDADRSVEPISSTRTVITCLVMMNIELFMAVIAGCMELLYRPLTSSARRMHNVECAIAVFNIIIYIMYIVTMILTSSILRGKRDKGQVDVSKELSDVIASPMANGREFNSRSERVHRSVNPYNSQSSFLM